MAPKRTTQPEKTAASSKASNKRQKTTTSTPESLSVPTASTPDLDYDKLAAAMLKQMSAQQKAALETITVRKDTVPPVHVPVAVSAASEVSTPTATPVPATSSNRAQSSQSMNSNLHVVDSNQGNPVISLIENLFGNHGEFIDDSNNKTTGPLNLSAGIPLEAGVSDRIKNKIWGKEYIDLKILLPTYTEEPFAVNITAGSFSINQGHTQKQPLSIDQWTTCFNTFTAIYISKCPEEAANLLKYAATIREIAANHGDTAWRHYDETFRRLRLAHRQPWQKPIDELYTKAANLKPFRGQHFSGKKQQNGPRPFRQKVCFAFNRGMPCTASPCKFKHLCQTCFGNHSKTKCYKAKQNFGQKSPATHSNAS